MSSYHLFRLFFTHLVQVRAPLAQLRYVRAIPNSYHHLTGGQILEFNSYPTCRSLEYATVSLELSPLIHADSQTSSYLELTVDSGTIHLDVSSSSRVNHSEIRADKDRQPVEDYAHKFDPNAAFLESTESGIYPYASSTSFDSSSALALNHPSQLRADIGSESASQSDRPRLQVDYPRQLSSTLTVVASSLNRRYISTPTYQSSDALSAITIDRSSPVNDSSFQNLPQDVAAKVDRTFVVAPQAELIDSYSETQELRLEFLPQGFTFIDWVDSQGDIVSRTWVSTTGGYLPSDTLGRQMTGASLFDTSVALIGAIASADNDLLSSALREIVEVYREYCIEKQIAGFPSYLPRRPHLHGERVEVSSSRSVLDNAWFGIALVKVVTYLRDARVQARISVSADVEQVLNDLAAFIALSIDPVTGNAISGYTDTGYGTNEIDLAATVASELFLSSYLTLVDNLFVKTRAARCRLAVSNLLPAELSLSEVQDSKELSDIYLYLAVWAVQNKSDLLLTEAILERYASARLSALTVDFTQQNALWLCLKSQLTERGIAIPAKLNDISAADLYWIYGAGVWGRKSNSAPDLLSSSLNIILERNYSLFASIQASLPVEDAYALTTYSYQTARRLWPFGINWTSPELEGPDDGALGALLYAMSAPHFEWYLTFVLARKSLSIVEATGAFLNWWGELFKMQRPPLVSDSFYRPLVFAAALNPRSTAPAIKGWVELIYSESVKVEEPTLPPIYRLWTLDASSTLVLNDDQLTADMGTREWIPVDMSDPAALLQALQVGNGAVPGFYYFPETRPQTRDARHDYSRAVFVPWSEFSCRLRVTAPDKYLPGLETDILAIESAGIVADVVVLQTDVNYAVVQSSGSVLGPLTPDPADTRVPPRGMYVLGTLAAAPVSPNGTYVLATSPLLTPQ